MAASHKGMSILRMDNPRCSGRQPPAYAVRSRYKDDRSEGDDQQAQGQPLLIAGLFQQPGRREGQEEIAHVRSRSDKEGLYIVVQLTGKLKKGDQGTIQPGDKAQQEI